MKGFYKYNTGETEEELKLKYNYEGSSLREAQKRMLEMLIFLDKICKENNIDYFIAFGTLLGAVRHRGFIPWDDDLDVYIDYKSIKKLRKIINSSDCGYVIQDYSTDKGFVRYYNVIRDLDSEYIKPEFIHNQRKYRGLQIDLFPFEYGVIERLKSFVAKSMGFNEKYLLSKHKFLSGLIFKVTRNIFIPIFKKIGYTFGDKNSISLGYEGVSPGYKYKVNDIFPLKPIEFEGYSVLGPNNPIKVLIEDYGEGYMDLPGEEHRDNHKVSQIIINKKI